MTMKEYSEYLDEETRRADKALLDQYKKELHDLEQGTGLAKFMYEPEIEEAKQQLRDAIIGLKYVDEEN